ncbi:MAG: ArsB/NhaD family transporter [Thermoleophilia bacterium]|nr:ArsB/NhaD family transporter [Thermoleophilia bacterium]
MELFASIAFVATLVLIATEWLHRTLIVMFGAATFVLIGVLEQHQAFESIDLATLGLLVAMMIIVAVIERTGIFEYLAIVALRASKGRPARVVFMLALLTAVLSAFLDNLTTVLLMAPLVIATCSRLGMKPAPLLIIMILASNIGGTATLVGDPPNIMIAGATGLSFNSFLTNLAPIAFTTLFVVTSVLYWAARRSFQRDHDEDIIIEDLLEDVTLATGRELWLPLSVLGLVMIGFVLHAPLHLEPATVALAGAALLLFLRGAENMEASFDAVDWTTLFFFAGLFVMVGGLEQQGVLEDIATWTRDVTGGHRTSELLGILGISALGSGVVDNIPFTAAMIPVVDQLNPGHDDSYWWALSLGACFGGNATIIAAAANVATQGVAERHGISITFRGFLGWGLAATAMSIAIAAGFLLLFHA